MSPAPSLRRSGGILAIATTSANLAGYVFFLILSRALTPDDLGIVGTLVNLTLIATVPALALQLVGARLVARRGTRTAAEHVILTTASAIGVVSALLIAALTPAIMHLTHLDTSVPVLLLAAAVPGIAVTFSVQGILQGEERFVRLSLLLLVAAFARLSSAVLAAILGWGPTGIMAVLTVGWYLSVGVALLARRHGREVDPPTADPGPEPVVQLSILTLTRSCLATAWSTSGLLALSSLDLLLARYFLDRDASGAYTVAALFSKAAFWGPSFLATLFYPRLARAGQRRRALGQSLGITAGVGVIGILIAAIASPVLVRLVAGDGYAEVGPLLWAFTAFGVTLAMVQVLVYAALAVNDHRLGAAVWAACAVAVLTISVWFHDSMGQIIGALLVVGVALVVLGLGLEARRVSVPRRATSGRRPH